MRAVTGQPDQADGRRAKNSTSSRSFQAERIAGRILGMGDVVSLVEKAAENFQADEAEKLAKKMMSGKFDLEDMLGQLKQLRKMGDIKGLMGMLPGINKMKKQLDAAKVDDGALKRQEAIILSMTMKERRAPDVIKASRKKAHRGGFGHHGSGGQQAPEAVRPDVADDEADEEARQKGRSAPRLRWRDASGDGRRRVAPGTSAAACPRVVSPVGSSSSRPGDRLVEIGRAIVQGFASARCRSGKLHTESKGINEPCFVFVSLAVARQAASVLSYRGRRFARPARWSLHREARLLQSDAAARSCRSPGDQGRARAVLARRRRPAVRPCRPLPRHHPGIAPAPTMAEQTKQHAPKKKAQDRAAEKAKAAAAAAASAEG